MSNYNRRINQGYKGHGNRANHSTAGIDVCDDSVESHAVCSRSEESKLISYIRKKFAFNTSAERMLLQHDSECSRYCLVYVDLAKLVFTSQKRYRSIASNDKIKKVYYTKHGYSIMEISKRTEWTAQNGMFSWIYELFNGAYTTLNNVQRGMDMVKSKTFRVFMIDVLATIVELRDCWLSPAKVCTFLMRLYTLSQRYSEMVERTFEPQGFGLIEGVAGLATLGLPLEVVNNIKLFTTLTGKRIMDVENIGYVLGTAFEALENIIRWICVPFGERIISVTAESSILALVRKFTAGFTTYNKVRSIVKCYTEYVKDSQMLFDPANREKILTLYKECKADPSFIEYVTNGSRYLSTTWDLFQRNIVLSAQAFEASSRNEPICIIFEGEPGSGKSTIMNQFVDLLRKQGMTTYCHSIPATNDGKDFYDDYENQDIFIMDDVGQQDVSQWRYIINFVSPVKYPLPCANAAKKNTKFFNSKVILATTNKLMKLTKSQFTKSDCISDPEALYRRCHVINVTGKRDNGAFMQDMSYFKFDYMQSHKWENRFLDDFANGGENITKVTDAKTSLTYLYRVYKRLLASRIAEDNKVNIPESVLDEILNDNRTWMPQNGNSIFNFVYEDCIDPISNVGLLKEYIEYYANLVRQCVTISVQQLVSVIQDISTSTMCTVGGSLLACAVGLGLWYVLSGDKQEEPVSLNEYLPQNADYPERVDNVKKHMRKIVYVTGEYVYGVVSGDKVLLPLHMDSDNKVVDIFHSDDHFNHNHKERENIRLRKVVELPIHDMGVYRMEGVVALYRKCHNLFLDTTSVNPLMYLVNAGNVIPVLYGKNVFRNNHELEYSRYQVKYKHSIGSGYITEHTAPGLCGTVLVNADQGIIGFHVAGSSNAGFCASPSMYARDIIRKAMLEGAEVSYEFKDKIVPDMSGARLQYDQPIKISPAIKATALTPSILHRDYNAAMETCISSIEKELNVTIDKKQPPNFTALGSPVTLLKKQSKKTMTHQGRVSDSEIAFVKEYIRTFFVEFHDIDDLTTAFGNESIPKLNSKSSNGYGIEGDKHVYFDFENKVIMAEGYKTLSAFKDSVDNGTYDYTKYVSRESFKDELRASNKVDNPRTFRVMPMPHIFYTKKCMANLVMYCASKMHETGMCLKFNPFKDMDVLYQKLRGMDVYGDADFSKWDGSINVLLFNAISDVIVEFYQGDKKFLKFLLHTMSQSMIIVGDELYATTHGLPSGTWITLFMNCLLNKALTALVIFRNSPTPTINQCYQVVDYVTGDDKIFGVSKEMSHIYNLITLKEVAESLGMTCTNGDKTPITSVSQPLSLLSYVKRHFKYHPKLKKYVGCLSIDTLLNTVQWLDGTKDAETVLHGKMQAVLIESYNYGSGLFNRLRNLFSEYTTTPLFTEERVEQILHMDDGYLYTLSLMGKDYSWMY